MTEISDWSDVEAQLQETKELLTEIEQRFLQVRHDSLKQHELQTQQEQIRAQIQDTSGDRPHLITIKKFAVNLILKIGDRHLTRIKKNSSNN